MKYGKKKRKSFSMTAEENMMMPEDLIMAQGERVPRGIEVEENTIYFYCPVGDQEALELNRLLKRLDVEMEYLSNRLNCDPIPIHLRVHSPGGSVFAGLSIVDAMNSCKSEIHTYVDGCAASAATLIVSSGTKKKRFIGNNGFMLIHQPHLEWSGKLDDFMDEVQNQEEIYEKVKKIYEKNCKIGGKKLEKLLQHELWLPAEKCLEIGLVDKIQ